MPFYWLTRPGGGEVRKTYLVSQHRVPLSKRDHWSILKAYSACVPERYQWTPSRPPAGSGPSPTPLRRACTHTCPPSHVHPHTVDINSPRLSSFGEKIYEVSKKYGPTVEVLKGTSTSCESCSLRNPRRFGSADQRIRGSIGHETPELFVRHRGYLISTDCWHPSFTFRPIRSDNSANLCAKFFIFTNELRVCIVTKESWFFLPRKFCSF